MVAQKGTLGPPSLIYGCSLAKNCYNCSLKLMAEEIHIRNMVCDRCIMAVGKILGNLGIRPLKIELGTVLTDTVMDSRKKEELRKALEDYGFALIDDRRSRTVEKIKTAVIEMVHYGGDMQGKMNLSEYVSRKCHADYSYLSKLFSEARGMSIERYYIAQRIERVKELLVYDELSVSEIAYMMNYSSPAHLSAQFKSITGLSPRQFKSLKKKPLIPLDRI